jgi:hypothetical protein
MPITSTNGGTTVITGAGIPIFRLLSLKGRINLEALGLKGRINATASAMREFGVPGKATAKNRAIVLQKIEEALKLAEENLRDEEQSVEPYSD